MCVELLKTYVHISHFFHILADEHVLSNTTPHTCRCFISTQPRAIFSTARAYNILTRRVLKDCTQSILILAVPAGAHMLQKSPITHGKRVLICLSYCKRVLFCMSKEPYYAWQKSLNMATTWQKRPIMPISLQ